MEQVNSKSSRGDVNKPQKKTLLYVFSTAGMGLNKSRQVTAKIKQDLINTCGDNFNVCVLNHGASSGRFEPKVYILEDTQNELSDIKQLPFDIESNKINSSNELFPNCHEELNGEFMVVHNGHFIWQNKESLYDETGDFSTKVSLDEYGLSDEIKNLLEGKIFSECLIRDLCSIDNKELVFTKNGIIAYSKRDGVLPIEYPYTKGSYVLSVRTDIKTRVLLIFPDIMESKFMSTIKL